MGRDLRGWQFGRLAERLDADPRNDGHDGAKANPDRGILLGAVPLLFLPRVTDPAIALTLVTVSACCGAMSLAAFGVNHLDVGPRSTPES